MTEQIEAKKVLGYKWDPMHGYLALTAATVLTFLFVRVEMPIPVYPTLLFILLLLAVAFNESWKAWKKSGRACITDLEITEGGHSSIHPYDIIPATQYYKDGKRLRSFMCFALGGFIIVGFNVQGSDAFIVCPPEHIEETKSAMICHTKLRNVAFEELEPHIQADLLKLKGFNRKAVAMKKNLWFGTVSKIDNSATITNLQKEQEYLDKNKEITTLKNIISDLHEQLDKRREMQQVTVKLDALKNGGAT